MDQQGRDLLDMDSRMFSKKESIDSFHQEIAEYFYPERANFTGEITLGEEFATHLTDFTPVMVRRNLADQIGSLVRPSDREWFKKSVENKEVRRDVAAKDFLEFMTATTRSILYSRDSGFRRMAKEHENDFAAFGAGASLVSYSADRSNLLMKCHHLKDMAFGENQAGQVDHAHRKADMTARSMLALFKSEDKFPQSVKDALARRDEKSTFKLRHIFVPLTTYDPYRKFPKWAKWADVYVTEDGKILQEIPSETFDYVISRWQTVSGSVYPFSPATVVALPQARMLQRMMHTLIEAGEKRVDPPLIATEDAVTSAVSLQAGAITYLDAEYDERMGAALRPLDLGKDVGLGEALINDSREMLAEAFFLNKLAPLSSRDKNMTAYEASQLVGEFIRNALPLFDPIEDEWTDNLLEVCTSKIMRAGGYGPIDANGIPEDLPDSLLGQDIKNQFSNALREARERQTINAFVESAQLIDAAASIDQGALAEVNTRTMFRDAFGAVPGGSADWLNGEQEAAQTRQQLNEQANAEAQVAEIAQGADVVEAIGQAAQSVGAA